MAVIKSAFEYRELWGTVYELKYIEITMGLFCIIIQACIKVLNTYNK